MTAVAADPVALLAQADLALLAARAFVRPERRALETLDLSAPEVQALLDLAGLSSDGDLAERLAAAMAETRALGLEAWQAELCRLFDGCAPCPADETAWIRRDKGAILADIAGFQRAFGLTLAEGAGEKQDHLAAELELVAMLLLKLALARRDADEEGAAVTRDALAAFAADHLGEWLPGFCLRLGETARHPLLRLQAELLPRLWEAVCAASDVARPRGKALAQVVEEAGSPYECGLAGAEEDA